MILKVPQNEVLSLPDLISAQPGQVANRTLHAGPALTLCLMALAPGEDIAAHSAPGDALVQILEGKAQVTVGEKTHLLSAGDALVMPKGVPHSLRTDDGFKMLLTLVKEN